MCRRYQFRFSECGHVENSGHWLFLCHQPGASNSETTIIERPQHCFRCLQQDQMPERQRNVYQPPDLADAARTFEQILGHHERHLDGPLHFDKAKIEVLALMNRRLSEEDRLFLLILEERLDAALWHEKEHVQDHRTLKDKRNLILQIRFAHLTAGVHQYSVIRDCNERITKAQGELQTRIDLRVRTLLQDVPDGEIEALDDDDKNCTICYSRLQNNGPHPGKAPDRLPCGHILCLDCASTWLGRDPGTCPSCRADFNLARDRARDFVTIMGPVTVAVARDNADQHSPWWMAIFRPV